MSSLTGAVPASAAPTGVDCGSGANLQTAINQAPAGSTLAVTGTCQGNFTIAKDLTLKGLRPAGFPQATLDGRGSGTTLTVAHGRVHLIHLTITGGNATQGGGVANSASLWLDRTIVTGNLATEGEGILNSGTLRLTRSFVSSNGNDVSYAHASRAILSEGRLTLVRSVVSLNEGGGIWSESGTLVIRRSTVSGNALDGCMLCAAGITSDGSGTITGSTVDDNWTESDGTGGVFNGGSMRIVFSTIALNGNADADSGSGGIENGGGTLTITSSTISANHSDYGAGAGIENDAGTVRMSATILAGNGQFDCNPENPPSAPITSEGYNIVGTLAGYPSCDLQAQPTDIVGTTTTSIDPKLKALGYYGGPTETMPPYPASPAVDAIPAGSTSADGTIALCPPAGTTDQRGVPRPQGPACDIGAVEVKE